MLKTALRPSCWEEEGAESKHGGGLKEREDDARGRRRGERKEADGLKAIVLEISDGGRGRRRAAVGRASRGTGGGSGF